MMRIRARRHFLRNLFRGVASLALLAAVLFVSARRWDPGYAGGIVGFLAGTAEDRFLRRRLPGYAAYAGHVRYRLLPGIW